METSNHLSFSQESELFQLGDFAGAIGDESIDQRDVCAVVIAFDAIGHGHIFGHEDVSFDCCGGGIGGEAPRSVSGGGDGELLQTEVAGHGDGGGESASFEGAGGIQSFIFDKDVGIFAAAQHGSKAFAERYRRGLGKNGVVAPHGGSVAAAAMLEKKFS